MTLEVGPGGYLLSAGDGEHLWFADGLLTYKATGDQTRGMLAVAEIRAPRGSGSPNHRHEHDDEAWYVLDGHLTFWLGDHQFTATAGDFVFGPRGVAHRFRVDSDEARFLLLLTPAGFEHFTRSSGWPASAASPPPADLLPRDGQALAEAANAAGITILSISTTSTTTEGVRS
jgi:quercetin dioxygenase-like cupin family protein